MSKKQSDADVLAKLQEMLGGRGVKDASFGPDDGGDSGSGSGGSGPAPDGPRSGGGEARAEEQRTATAAAPREEADEWDDGAALDVRDPKFVAFLQQCENELNASIA